MDATTSRIAHGSRVIGAIEGTLLSIEGRIEGAVRGDEVLVAAGGVVLGEIRARLATILGTVLGDVRCTERVTVRDAGRVTGELLAPTVDHGETRTGKAAPVAAERQPPTRAAAVALPRPATRARVILKKRSKPQGGS